MPKTMTLALFGEAEKGHLHHGVLCQTLPQLIDIFGQPPPLSRGLIFAIQSLLYGQELIYFRVREEGYSAEDYFRAIKQIDESEWSSGITAYVLPGVGDAEIIQALLPLCHTHHSLLITTQSDLYDYLTG